MYIFSSWTSSDSIAREIGFKYNGDDVYDDTQRILFTHSNKVVYEEDIDYLNGDHNILFDEGNDTLFQSKRYYSPSEAIFSVTSDKNDKTAEFYLKSIKAN